MNDIFNQNESASDSLPPFFRPLFWSYRFESVHAEKDKRLIVINTINYGRWAHWQWLSKRYGAEGVRHLIETTPVTEFRPGALRLSCVLFDVTKFHHARRGTHVTE